MTEAKKRRGKRHYLKMLAEGRCVSCGKSDDLTRQGRARCAVCNAKAHPKGPRIRTEEQREKENADRREWAQMRKEAHVCIDCGRQDARTIKGLCHCLQCGKKRADRSRETWDYAHEKELRDARRNRWIEAGNCSNCGGPKEDPDMAMCATCRVKAKMRKIKRQIKTGWLPRGANGMCYQCKKAPAIDGKKLCTDCYQKKIKVFQVNSSKRRIGKQPAQ